MHQTASAASPITATCFARRRLGPRKSWPAAIGIWVLLLGWACWVQAIELPDNDTHALPCRPTIACTADIVPPGTFEIEGGYIVRRIQQGTWQQATPLLLKFTVLDWIQLQVGTNGGVFATGPVPAEYLDDLTVGLKLYLHPQERRVPALAISMAASIPTFVSQPGYLRTYDALFTGYITKDFGRLHADLNVGFNVWRLDGPPLLQGFVALALSRELPHHFGIMLEGYAFSDAQPISFADAGLLGAVSLTPRPWLVLDVGGDLGLIQQNRSFSLFVGFTVIPIVLFRSAAR